MLRRSKKIAKRLPDNASGSSVVLCHNGNGHMRMTSGNASLESTVFGGESGITEQLENIGVVTAGFKVSLVTDFAI